jgi:hypothetical protein
MISANIVKFQDQPLQNPLITCFNSGDIWYLMAYQDTLDPYLLHKRKICSCFLISAKIVKFQDPPLQNQLVASFANCDIS